MFPSSAHKSVTWTSNTIYHFPPTSMKTWPCVADLLWTVQHLFCVLRCASCSASCSLCPGVTLSVSGAAIASHAENVQLWNKQLQIKSAQRYLVIFFTTRVENVALTFVCHIFMKMRLYTLIVTGLKPLRLAEPRNHPIKPHTSFTSAIRTTDILPIFSQEVHDCWTITLVWPGFPPDTDFLLKH